MQKASSKKEPSASKALHKILSTSETKRRQAVIIGLLGLGLSSIAVSVFLSSVPFAFIGLGLIFWGTFLVFTTSTKLVRADLAVSQLANSMISENGLLIKLGYTGKSVFSPPSLLGENPTQSISKPSSSAIEASTISLIPSGIDLERLIEGKSKVNFFLADLDYLRAFLPKILTDDMEIATGFDMSVEGGIIHIRLVDSVLYDLCEKIHNSDPEICARLPCPICSALACAITKAAHKDVIIKNTAVSVPSKAVDIWFESIELPVPVAVPEKHLIAEAEAVPSSQPNVIVTNGENALLEQTVYEYIQAYSGELNLEKCASDLHIPPETLKRIIGKLAEEGKVRAQ
jgi:hypothetical protein